MSILAEPRRKQRISIDPRNLQWKEDDNKWSKKMMEKMGWSDGVGLGKNKQGNVDSVKLKANHTGKGLGADKLAGYDSTWIGHHDDFADLLAALNKNKPKQDETEEEQKQRVDKMSIELSSKNIKRRIHYQKFTRMKDTANYTEQDKSAVLGVGLKRTKEDQEPVKEEAEDSKSSDSESAVSAGNTIVSTLSVGDYFAAKMAALKAKSQSCATVKVEVKAEVESEGEEQEYRATFQQMDFSYEETVKQEVKEEPVEEEDEKTRRRREKKERKQREREQAEPQVEEEDESERQRRKEVKKLRKLLSKHEEFAAQITEETTEKQLRKMEKRLRKKLEAQEEGEDTTSAEPERKRRKQEE